MHERGVASEPTLATALARPDACHEGVPLRRRSPGAPDIGSLVVAIVRSVDVEAVAGPADVGIVASGAVTTVDGHLAVLRTQRFEELLAQVFQPVVVALHHTRPILAVELLDCEVLTESMSCCHSLPPLLVVLLRRLVRAPSCAPDL